MSKYTQEFNVSFENVIGVEGRYSNHKADTGGATMFGITEKVARKWGYKGSMRKLPLETAKEIYYANYWKPQNLDKIAKISMSIADECFEASVNMGLSRPAKYLQRSINGFKRRGNMLAVDGKLGAKTLLALKQASKDKRNLTGIFKLQNCLQGVFYLGLAERKSSQKVFLLGWVNKRVVL